MEQTINNRIGVLFFSPTGTTKKICNALASGMGADDPLILDITHPGTRSEIIANTNTVLDKIDHLIAGAPVYCGKLPLQAIECLRALRGHGKKATAVAVYGNRDYGIALKPTYRGKICVKCGRCAEVCPTGILSSETGEYLNRQAMKNCIGCMACAKNCESAARIAKANLIIQLMMKSVLGQASRERKEPSVVM